MVQDVPTGHQPLDSLVDGCPDANLLYLQEVNMGILKTKTVYALAIDGKDVQLSEYDVAQLRNELCNTDDWRVQALRGLKIDAIKSVRGLTNCGLKEGKDAVEQFCAENGNAIFAANQMLAKVRGQVPVAIRLPPPLPPDDRRYSDLDPSEQYGDGPDDHDDIPF